MVFLSGWLEWDPYGPYLKNGYESNVGKRGQQINQTNPSLLLYEPDLKLTYLHW